MTSGEPWYLLDVCEYGDDLQSATATTDSDPEHEQPASHVSDTFKRNKIQPSTSRRQQIRRRRTVTVTGTAGVKKSLLGLDSWIAAAEEVSLQAASEGGKRRCRRDVQRQTVPNTGCSDWKGPVADGLQPRTPNEEEEVVKAI